MQKAFLFVKSKIFLLYMKSKNIDYKDRSIYLYIDHEENLAKALNL